MSTAALESQNTSLEVLVTTDSPDSYETFAQVKAINGPTGTANIIDVSDLQSTFKEKRVGLPDWGTMTLDLFAVPSEATFIFVKGLYTARTKARFRLTFTDSPATVWCFYAYISALSVTIGVDAPVNGSITLAIDGDIDETTA